MGVETMPFDEAKYLVDAESSAFCSTTPLRAATPSMSRTRFKLLRAPAE